MEVEHINVAMAATMDLIKTFDDLDDVIVPLQSRMLAKLRALHRRSAAPKSHCTVEIGTDSCDLLSGTARSNVAINAVIDSVAEAECEIVGSTLRPATLDDFTQKIYGEPETEKPQLNSLSFDTTFNPMSLDDFNEVAGDDNIHELVRHARQTEWNDRCRKASTRDKSSMV